MFDFGIDDVIIKPFTTDLMKLSARQFMQQVLHDELGITTLVIGYDHRFGYNRAEGFNDYVRYGKEMGIKVVLANEYQFDGKEVSSSAIRQAVSSGNISMANDLLGYHYSIEGQVINGFHIGRTIGYPTANIQLPNNKLVPADGVYAVTVMLDKEEYNGMLNIGHRPTFDNGQRSIEVHLLDFNRDIYSERIQLRFAERIREEKRFESIDELKAQISKDEHQIRMILRQR